MFRTAQPVRTHQTNMRFSLRWPSDHTGWPKMLIGSCDGFGMVYTHERSSGLIVRQAAYGDGSTSQRTSCSSLNNVGEPDCVAFQGHMLHCTPYHSTFVFVESP